jgi:hypothetical protein
MGSELKGSSPDMNKAALQAFFGLASRWQLSTREARELLGAPPFGTYYRWRRRKNGRLPEEVQQRISHLIVIYKALHMLLPAGQADGWLRKPNLAFSGDSALARMLAGGFTGLISVRQYLDDQLR